METALIRLRDRGQAADAYITTLCSGPFPLRRRAQRPEGRPCALGIESAGGVVAWCALYCAVQGTREREKTKVDVNARGRPCAWGSHSAGDVVACFFCSVLVQYFLCSTVQHVLCCTRAPLCAARAAQEHLFVLHKGTRHRIDTLTHTHTHVVWLGLQPQRRRPPQARTGWPTRRATTAKTSSRKWVCMHVRVVVYDVCHVCMLGLCYMMSV